MKARQPFVIAKGNRRRTRIGEIEGGNGLINE